ncbi:methyl-accepting chemotaxis protein [Marinitoga aeolica]|uniref:Cache domain-containing protein n=1 Tax=Marinitoga aeolica TaxID=2809031 RepID=A0ABY8PP33_9BACT|nr:cache domain-containing protein [Marinitoga aeolica]WGS64394.1 cache domain-containing protein [Marinitoga aeolica]
MKIELKYSFLISIIFTVAISTMFYLSYVIFSNIIREDMKNEYLSSISGIVIGLKNNFNSINETNFNERFGNGGKGYYYILDENGNVVFHSDKTKVGINILEDAKLSDLWEYMKKNEKGVYEYVYENEKRYVAFSKFNFNAFTYYFAHAVKESELFSGLRKSRNTLIFILIIFIVIVYILSFVISKAIGKEFKKQIKTIEEFTTNVSSYIAENSSAASEIESVANNTQTNVEKLDELIQNFSSSVEEGRSELNATLMNMKEFFSNIQSMNQMTLKIAEFINNLSSLNDKIKDISDTVSILSINSSIETSKENIDKEGISKIADLINELATDARNTSRNSENVLKEIENSITSNVLLSEKISKELVNVENSLDSISQVVENFAENVDSLTGFSHTTRLSMNEVLEGIKQTSEALSEIKVNLDKLLNLAKIAED